MATQASYQDLKFLKKLFCYRSIDEEVSNSVIKKFLNHLWYLTPELAALLLFDSNVSNAEKVKMCEALKLESINFVYEKKVLLSPRNVTELIDSRISNFICEDSPKFFERYKIDTTFLSKNPSSWEKERNYVLV